MPENQFISIKKSLNKAFRKLKPTRLEIDKFKYHFNELLEQTENKLNESEEFHKKNLNTFLEKIYYKSNHYVNSQDKNDLVIHNGNIDSNIGVIIETKNPANKGEILSFDKFNCKSLQQLLFYFLQQRIAKKNLNLKHLIITNIYDWFIFDVTDFENIFYEDKDLIKEFNNFIEGRLNSNKRDFFYQEIASKFIEQNEEKLKENCTYFNLKEYQNCSDDNELIPLYKILSPTHLLKLPFLSDSNTLDQDFYEELLHIIGLKEVEKNNITLIKRLPENERNQGSLLENTINQLDTYDKIDSLNNAKLYGNSYQEQILNVALELVITWINRILFLKLLEAQLISFNNDKKLAFLNNEKINNFNELDSLFFQILAKEINDRNEEINKKFYYIPYLNSSLFELSELEKKTIAISNLNYDQKLPLFQTTILKNNQGKTLTIELKTLNYLFEFLAAYDFSSEGKEEIQEENKTLINASVLGLIFEKINGYQDGSFFTPGLITMYMCKETIRKVIIEKFNKIKGWNCENIKDLYNKIENKQEANLIINSIKICDPSVGSGHFLVSSLNEIIVIKSELKILQDKEGKILRDYNIEVENDELIIVDDNGNLFEYKPLNNESQRIQETIFKEKQTIIENCLFGVDINNNSVKICRLRLWIELLKNAYYKNNFPKSQLRKKEEYKTLETLPNIDINIKCGNSLISRLPLDVNLEGVLKRNGLTIDTYKQAVKTYHHSTDKREKKEIINLIEKIKAAINTNDDLLIQLRQKERDLTNLSNQVNLLGETIKEKQTRKKQIKELEKEINLLRNLIEDKINNSLYDKAFEWRFEFPEVLDEEGDFIGFDTIIGNPPYLFARDSESKGITKTQKEYFRKHYQVTEFQLNLYPLFIEKGYHLLAMKGLLNYITPNNWLTLNTNKNLREFILNNSQIKIINLYTKIFKKADVDNLIVMFTKSQENNLIELWEYKNDFYSICETQTNFFLEKKDFIISLDSFKNDQSIRLLEKIELNSIPLNTIADVKSGLKAYAKGKGKPPQTEEMGKNRIYHSQTKIDNNYLKYLDGKNVCRYHLGWSGEYLQYGSNLAECRKDFSLFSTPRILVRQIPSLLPYCINACFTKEILLNDLNSMNIINIQESPQVILGILNSKLISYWFAYKFGKLQRGIFPQFKVKELAIFPISQNLDDYKKSIITLVDKILKMKKKNINADTMKLDREIDLLVYQIYGLTQAEIAIIEK